MESARSGNSQGSAAPSHNSAVSAATARSRGGGAAKIGGGDGAGPGSGRNESKPGSGLESTPMWRCLQEECWERVKAEAVKPDFRINIQDECFGWTAGHFASNAGRSDALKVLIEAKAKLDVADNEGNTMLMVASRKGHLKASEFLVGKKADLNAQNKNGWTALTWVAINGHEAVAQFLLGASADLLLADHEGRTPCMWAARHGMLDIVEAFLCFGLNLKVRDHTGFSVLDHCQDHLEMVSIIQAVGEVNDSLHQAAQLNDMDAVMEAIEAGADIDLHDGDGWTPLMWAAVHGSLDMVQLIIRYGAKPCLLDEHGNSIEHLQSQHLAVGDEVEKILGANDRLLFYAQNDDWASAEEELSIGAFINMRDDNARTSLMWAAKHCNASAVHMLLAKNANVNDRDSFGWAAVHFAVIEKSPETVSMFHYLGADMQVKNYEGDSLLHMAVRADDPVMIQLLIAAGLNTEEMDINLFTPLILASYNGLPESAACLVAYGASLEAKSTLAFGARGALALATVHGQEEAVAALLAPVQVPPKMPGEADDAASRRAIKKGASEASAGGSTSPSAAGRGAGPAKRSSNSSAAASGRIPPKAKQAASGVAARKKVAPKAQIDFQGDSPEALLQEAIRLRSQQPWKGVPNPAKVGVKQTDCTGASSLALAVRYKRTTIGTMLLQAKADPNAADDMGTTVLMEAVLTRQTEVVEHMLALGAQVEKRNKQGQNAIDICEDEVIRQLLNRKITLDRVPSSDPAQEAAAAEREAKALEQLMKSNKYYRMRIENLPRELDQEELKSCIRETFKRSGANNPKRINVALDPISERPRGHAYADFLDAAAQDLAMLADGEEIFGMNIRICKEPTRPN